MQAIDFANTIRWYNTNAMQYASNIADAVSTNRIDKFVSLLPKGSKVLDAGCAAGRDVNVLSQRGFNAVGIDISSGLIKIAKQKFPHLPFVQGDFLKLPFADNSFDGIWAHASLLHLETIDEVKRAFSEFNRVLRKQGILYDYVKAQMGTEKTETVKDKLSNEGRFVRYYTLDEMRQFIEENGFELIHLEQTKENLLGRSNLEWIAAYSRKS